MTRIHRLLATLSQGLVLTIAWFLGAACPPLPGQSPAERVPTSVLVVKINERLDSVTLALINRAVDEVRERGIRHLVLDIRTDAAELAELQQVQGLLGVLQRSDDINTIAFVGEFALDAGAMLALACDKIYMAPNAFLGAAAGDTSSTGTQIRKILRNESTRKEIPQKTELMLAALKGTSRDTAVVQRLARAMVDFELNLWAVSYDKSGLVVDDVVDAATLKQLEADPGVRFSIPPEKLPAPLTLNSSQAARLRLIDGQVDGLELMVQDRLGQDPASMEILVPSWSEGAVSWINAMRPVLLVLGFILILIEFKTPGFALPGILGCIMFGLAFFGAYMVGLADLSEILLFFAGLGLIAIEIWVMPGTIFFGVAGFLCIVTGLILAQQDFVVPSNETQTAILVGHLFNFMLVMLGVIFGTWAVYANIHRIPLLKAVVQEPPAPAHAVGTGTSSHEEHLAGLQGAVGVLASDLRPAGWMDVAGERVDVVSEGAFLDKGTEVEVVEVRGNRVVVAARGRGAVQGDPQSGEVTWGVLVLLVLVGLTATVAEIFFVSGGILGIVAGVSLISSIFLAFTAKGALAGWIFLGGSAIAVPLTVRFAFRVLPHTPFGKAFYLSGPEHEAVSGKAQEAGLDALIGKAGETACDLRPSGYVLIDGRRVDAVTRGEMIPQGSRVEVFRAELNQVVVRRAGDATN